MTTQDEHLVPLFCQQDGAGRPVLLLHGLLGASANLAGIARELARNYLVLRVDLRNHGRSPHAAAINYPLMAADVLQLLDERHIGGCAVIGHSMGGKVAMELALAAPRRVACLVVVDIAPVAYPPDRHEEPLRALAGVDLAAAGSRAGAERMLAERIADPGLRQFLLTNLQRRDGRLVWRVNLPALIAQRAALAAAPSGTGRYRGPTLFIKGSESSYIEPGHQAAIAHHFPGARLRVVQGAGHWVHADRPAAFNHALARFLAQVYPASTGGAHPDLEGSY